MTSRKSRPSGAGSSPHTRGALGAFVGSVSVEGIIPAYAGSTFPYTLTVLALGDHPRIRGERILVHVPSATPIGSSPHTRGARSAPASHTNSARIIPAYAGSTRRESLRRHDSADHPRIRGEHGRRVAPRADGVGSSPHTRGARGTSRSRPTPRRIIPAYAGSTMPAPSSPSSERDHPRIRGEHWLASNRPVMTDGSSPHTRGAHARGGASGTDDRIIPAYAGSTKGIIASSTHRPDHPRIRGEHKLNRLKKQGVDGSSPHTRGARYREIGFETIDMDHPRIRGEHWRLLSRAHPGHGSSPHTRGARPGYGARRQLPGIIPAYAGSTRALRIECPRWRDHPRIRGEHRRRRHPPGKP